MHPKGIKAQRLKRVFRIDIAVCERCDGLMKIFSSIEDPVVIEKSLGHWQARATTAPAAGAASRTWLHRDDRVNKAQP
jgi:hypothetical protein